MIRTQNRRTDPFCRRVGEAKRIKNEVINYKKRKTMEENENLTAERSLEIIRESIEQSRRAMTKHAGTPMIWWGSLVVVFAVLIAYLWKSHGGPVWNVLWFVMTIIGMAGEKMMAKRREPLPNNIIGSVIGKVWSAFGIFCCGLGFITCLAGLGVLSFKSLAPASGYIIPITSIITFALGMASTTTGLILKNRVISICSVIAGIGGFFLALRFAGGEQLLVMAAVAVVGLVIPGIIVNIQTRE